MANSKAQKPTRLLLQTPSPKATVSMGKPRDNFGYTGFSIQSDDHMFVHVEKDSLFQHSGGVTRVVKGKISALSDEALSISTGNTGSIASQGVMLITSGMGHGGSLQGLTGDGPLQSYFDKTKLNPLIERVSRGVRSFDADYKDSREALRDSLGYPAPKPEEPEGESPYDPDRMNPVEKLVWKIKHLVRRIDALKARAAAVQARISGNAVGKSTMDRLGYNQPATAHSADIEQFLTKAAGLIALAKAAIDTAGTVESKLSLQHDAGKKIEEYFVKADESVGKVNDAFDKVADKFKHSDSDEHTEVSDEDAKKRAADLAREEEEKKKRQAGLSEEERRADDEKHAEEQRLIQEKKDRDNELLKNGRKVKEFVARGPDIAEDTRETSQHIKEATTEVVSVVDSVAEKGTSKFGLMGPPGPGSVVGLVAHDGIAMVTPKRWFAHAADGFHFVSSPTLLKQPDWYQAKLTKLAKVQEAKDKINAVTLKIPSYSVGAGDFIHNKVKSKLAPEKEVEHQPGFTVLTSGKVDIGSQSEVGLFATGDKGVVRLQAQCATEISADSAIWVAARSGSVEMTGRAVQIGIPSLEDAKKAVKDNSPEMLAKRALLDRANKEYQEAVKKSLRALENLEEAKNQYKLVQDDLQSVNDQIKEAGFLQPDYMAGDKVALETKEEQSKTVVLDLEEELEVRNSLVSAKSEAKQIAASELQSAQTEVAGISTTSKLFGCEGQTQLLTESVQAAALDRIDIYGGERVTVESKKVALVASHEDPTEGPARVLVETNVTIQVGSFAIKVTRDAVVISNGESPTLTLSASGLSLDAGQQPVTVKGSKLNFSGELVGMEGKQINLG